MPIKPEWKALYEDGVTSYENGAYGNAIRKLREVADNPQTDDETRVNALKFIAFSYCVSPGPKATNLPLCRQAFARALRINSAFELTPGERGHPVWGKEFQAAKKALASQPRTEDPRAGSAKAGSASRGPTSTGP